MSSADNSAIGNGNGGQVLQILDGDGLGTAVWQHQFKRWVS
jgi:hypothetical protein